MNCYILHTLLLVTILLLIITIISSLHKMHVKTKTNIETLNNIKMEKINELKKLVLKFERFFISVT